MSPLPMFPGLFDGAEEEQGLLAQPGPSIFDRLGSLISGDPSGALSPEQNAAAQKEAILNASLMALLAGGQGENLPTGIAQAILAGRTSGQASRQGMVQAQQMQQLGQLAQTADRAKLMQLFSQAVGSGNMDVAKAALEAIKSLPPEQAAQPWDIRTVDGALVAVNPRTLEHKVLREAPPAAAGEDIGTPVARMVDGKIRDVVYDKKAHRWRDANTFAIVTAEPLPEGTNKANATNAAAAFAAEDALRVLQTFRKAPDFVQKFFVRGKFADVTRFLATDRAQEFFAASGALASQIVRLISGAQASEHEVRRIERAFIPQPGERESVVKQKLERLDTWMSFVTSQGGVDGVNPEEAWRQALRLEGRSEEQIAEILRTRRRGASRQGSVDPNNPFGGVPKR